jgi:hypothetical protein
VFARRSLAWGGLVAAVTVVHLWVGSYVTSLMHLEATDGAAAIHRIELSFERELQQAEPPEPAARPAAPPPAESRAVAAAPPAAASAPGAQPPAPGTPAAPPPEPPPQPEAPRVADAGAVPGSPAPADAAAAGGAPASEPAAPTTTTATLSVPGPAAPAPPSPPPAGSPPAAGVDAATGKPFEWPPSTRLSYTLTGDFRGPVEGSARVEWLRQGARYQVHLDVAIGPSFAPLVRRRMSSEGELTEQGLKPTRYEEETRVPLAATRRKSIAFETDRIVLQGPKSVPNLAGVQDTASQFVQLTWLFTTQPQQLRAGGAVVVPLALPHRVDRWTYDVMGEETLDTPAGRIPTFWIKPRRENWKPGELAIEAWFAPSLQYLPVRIMIRQDAQTYADLMLQRLPQQSGPESQPPVRARP